MTQRRKGGKRNFWEWNMMTSRKEQDMCIYTYSNLEADEDVYDRFIVDKLDMIDKLEDIPEKHSQDWWISKIKDEDPFLTDKQIGWILKILESDNKINDIREDEGEFFEMADIIEKLEESHEDEALSSKEWVDAIHKIGEDMDMLFTESQIKNLLNMLEKDGFVSWSCP